MNKSSENYHERFGHFDRELKDFENVLHIETIQLKVRGGIPGPDITYILEGDSVS